MRVSHATAYAIANAIPVTGQTGPAVLLAVDPEAGLVVALGSIVAAIACTHGDTTARGLAVFERAGDGFVGISVLSRQRATS